MIELSELLVQEELPEATVIRIGARKLHQSEQIDGIKTFLFQLIDTGKDRLILDLTGVEFLNSACLGMLLMLRRKLIVSGKTFQPPCRRRGLFAIVEDKAEALEAIRQGETDPLLLCGLSPDLREVFQVC